MRPPRSPPPGADRPPARWQCLLDGPDACAPLAQALAAAAAPGQVLGLDGPLAAGKTTLVRHLAAALGVFELAEVTSPTYALMHSYPAPAGPLVHIDLWRCEAAAGQLALGLQEALHRPDGLVAVEWACRAVEGLPPRAWRLHLQPAGDGRRLARALGPPLPEDGRLRAEALAGDGPWA